MSQALTISVLEYLSLLQVLFFPLLHICELRDCFLFSHFQQTARFQPWRDMNCKLGITKVLH